MKDEELSAPLRGKEIQSISICNDEYLEIVLEKGEAYKLYDSASYCCEERTMTCDDELPLLQGAVIIGIEVLPEHTMTSIPESDDYGQQHDIVFVRLMTTKGDIRVCMHNSHNGYYAGFEPAIERINRNEGDNEPR